MFWRSSLSETRRTADRSRLYSTVALRAVALVALGLCAAAIELHYGRRGFMPIDQSVVFDGGWRTLSGQVPFRDYTTPNAITPSLIQGLFFWVLGVSWTVYLIHAAVFNALFAMLVYILLRLCRGNRLASFFYGALSAVVFYPPVGAPFHDQHAFFFALLAITLAVAARNQTRSFGVQRVLWVAVPFALTAAALSKQTPALLSVPVVLALAAVPRSGARRALTSLTVGSAASILFVVASAVIAGVEWELVRVYFLELPLATGQARGEEVDSTASSLAFLAITFLVLVAGPSLIAQRVTGGGAARLPPGVALPLALSAALLLMCAAFMSLTHNEPTEGMPLFFASFGLFHVSVVLALPASRNLGSMRLAVPVGIGIAIVAVATAWTFNTHVNDPRAAINIDFDQSTVEPAVPPGLSFMQFQVPTRYMGLRAEDVRAVVSYLRSKPGNFVLVGDTTILNGLTGKPSVFPALYLTGALTIPKPGTPELVGFEQRLFLLMGNADVRRVVLEQRTWEGVSLSDLPRFRSLVDRCTTTSRTVGFFKVIELASRPSCRKPA